MPQGVREDCTGVERLDTSNAHFVNGLAIVHRDHGGDDGLLESYHALPVAHSVVGTWGRGVLFDDSLPLLELWTIPTLRAQGPS